MSQFFIHIIPVLWLSSNSVPELHRKQCIQSFNVFDFLKDVVSRVPDLGGSDGGAESATKRR